MKKIGIFALLGLGCVTSASIAFGAIKSNPVAVKAEEEVVEPVTEEYECKVVIETTTNGSVVADKLEGHVGELVTLTVEHDLFYLIDAVSVNGTNLVEDENVSGLFTFALVEGENKVAAKFVVDANLLGELSVIYEQAKNKDWTNLFSVENVVRIVTFLLNGGILIAVARYFIKDKRLEKKVEVKIENVMNKIMPETTKEIIISNFKEIILPYFTQMLTDLNVKVEDIGNAMTVLSRCMALAQENTPESKLAITKELSSLKLSDQASISAAEERIRKFIADQTNKMSLLLQKMDDIEQTNKQIIESSQENTVIEANEKVEGVATSEEEKPSVVDNGIQI